MINIAELKNAVEGDLHLIVFLSDADSVKQVEIFGNFDFLGSNLIELLVVQCNLYCVEHIEPIQIIEL